MLKILGLLIPFFPVLATANCDYATRLVTQSYDVGDKGQYAKEKKLLKQALQLCPNHADAHNNLASLFENEGNYIQAITHYRQALKTKPDYANAWYGLGETYYKQGQFPLSLEAHLHACKTDKDSRKRVQKLLRNNSFAVTEAGQILNKDSLLLLYDPARRQTINQLISDCGLKLARVKPAITFRNFQFKTGKSQLQPGTEPQLESLVAALINLPNRTVEIHGHTDNQAFAGFSASKSKQLNQKLSKQRAATVARFLSQRGISKTRLKIFGHGDEMPVSSRILSKNRRVEIEVK